MNKIIGNCPGVVIHVDDILVIGNDEHDEQYLSILKECLTYAKCKR